MVTFPSTITNRYGVPGFPDSGFSDSVRIPADSDSARILDSRIIDQLLQHPLKVARFKPLSREEIYERT